MRFLADEDFDNDILRGPKSRLPVLDVLRVQDVGLAGKADPILLAWAADAGRILLTHDVNTMTHYSYERLRQGLPLTGIIEVSQHLPIGEVIDLLELVSVCSLEGEYEGKVVYLANLR